MRLEGLLDAVAESTPDAVALIEPSGRHWSYRELEASAGRIAAALRAVGVEPGDRVGLCGNKRIEMVAAIFGILKSGAAYVPVDPGGPFQRAARIFFDCSVRVALVDQDRAGAFSDAIMSLGGPALKGHAIAGGFACLEFAACDVPGDRDLAYILYTSGSTGVPKGVCHTHASALAFLNWCSDEFRPTSRDRFSSHAPFHFDLSVLDIFLPLRHGAAIRLIGEDEGRNPRAISQLIATEQLTVWYSTPTILRALVEYGRLDAWDHSALRLTCFAGEIFPPRYLRSLATHWSGSSFYNLYGPTETNVCTYYCAPASELTHYEGEEMPIGRACSGNDLLVASSEGESLQPLVEGELLVSGDSVMRGYWGMPSETQRALVNYAGRTWYRTGDIVIERSDGMLLFRGRADRMVKRRGYRIELGEIEAALLKQENISQAATVAVTTSAGDVVIVAFLVPSAGASPTFLEMKRASNKSLPSYMSPDAFRILDRIPTTTTDKTDYVCLQETAHGLFSES